MMMALIHLIARLTHRPSKPSPRPEPLGASNEERRLAQALDEAPDGEKEPHLAALIEYLGSGRTWMVRTGVRDSRSRGGVFRCCDDIYGSEVHMRPYLLRADFRGMIDCSPKHYGLTSDQGRRLFKAVCALPTKNLWEQ